MSDNDTTTPATDEQRAVWEKWWSLFDTDDDLDDPDFNSHGDCADKMKALDARIEVEEEANEECEGWRQVAVESNLAVDAYLRKIKPDLPEHYGMPVDGVRIVVDAEKARADTAESQLAMRSYRSPLCDQHMDQLKKMPAVCPFCRIDKLVAERDSEKARADAAEERVRAWREGCEPQALEDDSAIGPPDIAELIEAAPRFTGDREGGPKTIALEVYEAVVSRTEIVAYGRALAHQDNRIVKLQTELANRQGGNAQAWSALKQDLAEADALLVRITEAEDGQQALGVCADAEVYLAARGK